MQPVGSKVRSWVPDGPFTCPTEVSQYTHGPRAKPLRIISFAKMTKPNYHSTVFDLLLLPLVQHAGVTFHLHQRQQQAGRHNGQAHHDIKGREGRHHHRGCWERECGWRASTHPVSLDSCHVGGLLRMSKSPRFLDFLGQNL